MLLFDEGLLEIPFAKMQVSLLLNGAPVEEPRMKALLSSKATPSHNTALLWDWEEGRSVEIVLEMRTPQRPAFLVLANSPSPVSAGVRRVTVSLEEMGAKQFLVEQHGGKGVSVLALGEEHDKFKSLLAQKLQQGASGQRELVRVERMSLSFNKEKKSDL